MDTKEYNLIMLHNSAKLIKLLFKNKEKSIKECYEQNANPLVTTAGKSLKIMLQNIISELSLEVMSLSKECFGNNDYNAIKDINEILKNVKKDLPSEFATLNGDGFLKLIRDSVAHNSQTNNHVKDEGNFVLSLPQKKASGNAQLSMSKLSMIETMLAYDNARKLNKQFFSLCFEDDYDDLDSILLAKENGKKFQDFIEIENIKGDKLLIDDHQEKAYYKFLLKFKKYEDKLKDFNYFKVRFFPIASNSINNYEFKCRLLAIMGKFYVDINKRRGDIEKYFKSHNDECGMFCAIDEEVLLSIIYSSMCFSMVSARTNKELLDLLKSAGCGIEEDQVRHLRNSFIHGRYFYNFDNGFEIYDGAKDLQHVTTFTYNQIEKLYQEFSKDNIKKIEEERNKTMLK